MDPREALIGWLDRHAARHPREPAAARVRALVAREPRCFERDCLPGHVTASCWIVSHDGTRCLLTHHRKLGRWLQLGGHVDGDADVVAAALREAREESGMQRFTLVEPARGCPVVDVDVHRIPAHADEPAHEHHDVRFVLRAAPGQALAISRESTDLRWFSWGEAARRGGDESVLRLARRARAVLAAREGASATSVR